MPREPKAPTLAQKITFQFERLAVRGAHYRVLLLWGIIVLITLIGGVIAYVIPAGGFDHLKDAVWWAFLHLSDPGYLGDDDTLGVRILAIALMVLGMVVFVGALIAIITQWFADVMQRLALGMTPIRANHHVVILGWTNRSLELAASLLQAKGSDRVSKVVMMVEESTPQILQEVRDRIGTAATRRGSLILRSGDPRQIDQLARVDPAHARAIILPAGGAGSDAPQSDDSEALRIVANLGSVASSGGSHGPQVVAEILEPAMADAVRHTYPADAQIVMSPLTIGRALGLAVVSPGLSFLMADLLDSRRGCSIRTEKFPQLEGETIQNAATRFPRGALVGAFQSNNRKDPNLRFKPDDVIRTGDHLVFVASIDEGLAPEPARPLGTAAGDPHATTTKAASRRVLLLGWNSVVPHLLHELTRHRNLDFDVDIVAPQDVIKRSARLAGTNDESGVTIHHLVEDPVMPQTFAGLDLEGYDSVVIVTGEGTDSNVATFFLLDHALSGAPKRPHVIMELLDTGCAELLESRSVEVLNTPVFVADMLAGVVTHADMAPVFDTLFQRGLGTVRAIGLDELVGERRDVDLFELGARLRSEGMVLMGYQRAAAGFKLTIAPDKRERLVAQPGDRAVVFDYTG